MQHVTNKIIIIINTSFTHKLIQTWKYRIIKMPPYQNMLQNDVQFIYCQENYI